MRCRRRRRSGHSGPGNIRHEREHDALRPDHSSALGNTGDYFRDPRFGLGRSVTLGDTPNRSRRFAFRWYSRGATLGGTPNHSSRFALRQHISDQRGGLRMNVLKWIRT